MPPRPTMSRSDIGERRGGLTGNEHGDQRGRDWGNEHRHRNAHTGHRVGEHVNDRGNDSGRDQPVPPHSVLEQEVKPQQRWNHRAAHIHGNHGACHCARAKAVAIAPDPMMPMVMRCFDAGLYVPLRQFHDRNIYVTADQRA
jgi:hypothetical protein